MLTTYSYDNASRMVSVLNPKGLFVTTVYDDANQTIASINQLSDRTTYTYDNDGRRTEILNPAGGRITMVYDNRGSMTAIANELNQRTTYTYNSLGNVATRSFASGDVTTYTYDDNARETLAAYADGNQERSFSYDAIGQVELANQSYGFLLFSESSFIYDALGQLTHRDDSDPANTFSQRYSYDAAGQRTVLYNPNGSITTYTYDSDSRMSKALDPSGGTTTFQYDARNLKTTATFASGLVQGWAFDSDARNTSLKSVGTSTFIQTYTYDNNGNRLTILDGNGSVSTYTYDSKDRLTLDVTSVTNAHTYTYTYDSRDNITLNTETGNRVTLSYDAASRLTTSVSGATTTTYTYSSNGNLTNTLEGTTRVTMSYDFENKLRTHSSSGGVVTMAYDAFGNKCLEQGPSSANIIVWDGDTYLGEHGDGTKVDQIDKLYISAGQTMIAEATRSFATADKLDYVVDFLGSITARSNETAKLANPTRYKPYGTVLSGSTSGKFNWTGNTGSRVTGLTFAEQYNRARHYSSTTSQWTTVDFWWPAEQSYNYAASNPIRYFDPFGENAIPPPGPGPCVVPPKPLEFISCDPPARGAWNAFIYAFCNCNRTSMEDRAECNRMAREYFMACHKGFPGPGDFAPPPGGDGEIAPRPEPPCQLREGPPKPCSIVAAGLVIQMEGYKDMPDCNKVILTRQQCFDVAVNTGCTNDCSKSFDFYIYVYCEGVVTQSLGIIRGGKLGGARVGPVFQTNSTTINGGSPTIMMK